MSILDDAIREHLELKRAHGADESEVKKLEDEAFGPPQRPEGSDSFAEAPTEFMSAPETAVEERPDAEAGRRVPNVADLQEAPQPQEPPADEASDADEPGDGPAEEEHPAMEHEAIAEPGPTTEERHAIAAQPTEMFDVEGQFEAAPAEADAPSDEELAAAEQSEPSIAPPAEEEEPVDEFDEFFSEQRLSDELNQALEAPLPAEPSVEHESNEFELVEPVEAEEDAGAGDDESPPVEQSAQHEDVLEDTPDFLEESPEDDDLWFEQKPPKDIDFGD
jgi:hypothetical protein